MTAKLSYRAAPGVPRAKGGRVYGLLVESDDIVEIDATTGKKRAIGAHPGARAAVRCGVGRLAVIDASTVSLYRREERGLVLLDRAPVGGHELHTIREGGALLVLTKGGWALVFVDGAILWAVPGVLRCPEDATPFERDGRVYEDDDGRVREIVLPDPPGAPP